MNWLPFKFCRASTAARLDKLETETQCLRAHIRLLDKLHAQTAGLAKRSARELAAVIRDAAGRGGASE